MITGRSNVAVRSNIYIRSDRFLTADPAFRRQVRGAKALKKLRRMLGWAEADFVSRLSPRQRAELNWTIPCADCESIPAGLVKGTGAVELRCPLGKCAPRT
jgi:hypothetical protein